MLIYNEKRASMHPEIFNVISPEVFANWLRKGHGAFAWNGNVVIALLDHVCTGNGLLLSCLKYK